MFMLQSNHSHETEHFILKNPKFCAMGLDQVD